MTPLLPPPFYYFFLLWPPASFSASYSNDNQPKGVHLGLSSIVKTVLSILKSNFYRHWFGFLLHNWSNVQCPHSTYPLIQNSPISSPFLATQTETRHPINKQQASTMNGYLAGQRYKATTRTCDLGAQVTNRSPCVEPKCQDHTNWLLVLFDMWRLLWFGTSLTLRLMTVDSKMSRFEAGRLRANVTSKC